MISHALILLAGPPGTGKSHLMRLIEQRYPGFHEVSFDDIKEAVYDRHGFDNQAEKDRLYDVAQSEFFEAFESQMEAGRNIISDYPFGPKQYGFLKDLCTRRGWDPFTIRLTADFDVLFERQRKRDLDVSRHPGHLLSSYRPGQFLASDQRQALVLDREEFRRRCTTRGYQAFQLGELVEVDTTDFSSVDYDAVLEQVGRHYEQDPSRRQGL